jgi:hypothetical protein
MNATENFILSAIDMATSERSNDWPGLPVSQLPLSCGPAARDLIARGLICVISRPSTIDPKRSNHYYARTGQ